MYNKQSFKIITNKMFQFFSNVKFKNYFHIIFILFSDMIRNPAKVDIFSLIEIRIGCLQFKVFLLHMANHIDINYLTFQSHKTNCRHHQTSI